MKADVASLNQQLAQTKEGKKPKLTSMKALEVKTTERNLHLKSPFTPKEDIVNVLENVTNMWQP